MDINSEKIQKLYLFYFRLLTPQKQSNSNQWFEKGDKGICRLYFFLRSRGNKLYEAFILVK